MHLTFKNKWFLPRTPPEKAPQSFFLTHYRTFTAKQWKYGEFKRPNDLQSVDILLLFNLGFKNRDIQPVLVMFCVVIVGMTEQSLFCSRFYWGHFINIELRVWMKNTTVKKGGGAEDTRRIFQSKSLTSQSEDSASPQKSSPRCICEQSRGSGCCLSPLFCQTVK